MFRFHPLLNLMHIRSCFALLTTLWVMTPVLFWPLWPPYPRVVEGCSSICDWTAALSQPSTRCQADENYLVLCYQFRHFQKMEKIFCTRLLDCSSWTKCPWGCFCSWWSAFAIAQCAFQSNCTFCSSFFDEFEGKFVDRCSPRKRPIKA